jgi:hypothetical protein
VDRRQRQMCIRDSWKTLMRISYSINVVEK